MQIRNEAKVGLIVFLGIVALIGVYWFLGGWSLRRGAYPIYAVFCSARQLNTGSDVRMAGVKVGIVQDVLLTKESAARVNMLIWREYDIPKDSVARITTGGFIGDNYIEIIPGHRKPIEENGRLASESGVDFDRMLADANELLGELKTSAKTINSILGDKKVIADIKGTMASMNSAAESAAELVDSAHTLLEQSSPELRATFANLREASDNAVAMSEQLNDILTNDAKPNVHRILCDASTAVKNLNSAILQAQDLIGAFKESPSKVNASLENIGKATEDAEKMMTNLAQASEGVKNIAGDAQVQEDIKKALHNAAEASEQAKQLLESLNRKFGSSSCPSPGLKSQIPEYGTSVNALWETNAGDYRFDANYTFAGDENEFYRLGAMNIGENTRVNLQEGRVLSPKQSIRYGIFSSRVGVGYDRALNDRFQLTGEVYRPNDPRAKFYGTYGLTDQLRLYAGMDNLFGGEDEDVLVGIQYRK